jgi:hypothetical protein
MKNLKKGLKNISANVSPSRYNFSTIPKENSITSPMLQKYA